METSACTGPAGGSARSAATNASTPSGLWATSNSHRPRRSSRPGSRASSNAAATLSLEGLHRRGSASSTASATAALRRWWGPASPSVPSQRLPGSTNRVSTVAPRCCRATACRAASARSAASAGSDSPITKGTPGLAIPAFSRAICSSESPRYFMWSSAIWVTALTSGVTTLVLSSRPPRPTSTTAISAPRAAKSASAMAVVISKKVALVSSASGRRCSVQVATASRVMGAPLTRIRSRNDTRWGEV